MPVEKKHKSTTEKNKISIEANRLVAVNTIRNGSAISKNGVTTEIVFKVPDSVSEIDSRLEKESYLRDKSTAAPVSQILFNLFNPAKNIISPNWKKKRKSMVRPSFLLWNDIIERITSEKKTIESPPWLTKG